jgi:hypothetical protein
MPEAAALLKQTGNWRKLLVRSAAEGNGYDAAGLNAIVDGLIDDLLFLRMCELRGLLCGGSVRSCAAAEDGLGQLGLLSQQVHARCGVERPARQPPSEDLAPGDSPNWPPAWDARLLRTIVEKLYDASCSQTLRRAGLDLLGQVYERSVGQSIQRIPDRQSVSTLPVQGRKHAGVYYTPAHVVQYIVDRSLGDGFDDPSDPANDPRVLDPACGAGAFLVTAYQHLLDRYCDWYATHDPANAGRRLQRSADGRWVLSFPERRRILLASIYGVDQDRRAVQVTRRALLLKLLECETALQPPQSRASLAQWLPDLRGHIRCGNSLVAPEVPDASPSATQPGSGCAFDYPAAFPEVFARDNPGFDAIVGNPPYINIRLLSQTLDAPTRGYLGEHYRCATGLYDLYVLFVERAFALLRNGGRFGMILPNKIATADYARTCRELLQRHTSIDEIVDLSSLQTFGATGVYPYLLFWRKQPPLAAQRIAVRMANHTRELRSGQNHSTLLQRDLSATDGFAIHGHLDVERRVTTRPLGQLARLHSGTTGFVARRTAEALVEREAAGSGPHFEFIVSGNIDPYRIRLGNVRFQHATYVRPVLPRDTTWLSDNKRQLYAGPKLVIAGMTKRLEVAWDPAGLALGVQVYAAAEFGEDFRYLLGILNSTLISSLFRQRFAAKHLAGGYLAINKGQLEKIPIRCADAAGKADVRGREQLIRLVQQRMEMQPAPPGLTWGGQETTPQPPETAPQPPSHHGGRSGDHQTTAEPAPSSLRVEDGRERLQPDIAALDEQIDEIVFSLYRISDDERQKIAGQHLA